MMRQRLIHPDIIPGESVTRFYLCGDFGDMDGDIHVSHYPDGDITQDAQWYSITERPTEFTLETLRKSLSIDKEDWRIIEHIMGSFRWVKFYHPVPPTRSRICMDEQAARTGEWATSYF